MRDISKTGAVIDAATGAGATDVNSITFRLDDQTAAEASAREQAVKSARAKADTIANAAGVDHHGCHLHRRDRRPVPTPIYFDSARASGVAADQAPTPVQGGTIDLTVDGLDRVQHPLTGTRPEQQERRSNGPPLFHVRDTRPSGWRHGPGSAVPSASERHRDGRTQLPGGLVGHQEPAQVMELLVDAQVLDGLRPLARAVGGCASKARASARWSASADSGSVVRWAS